MTAEGNAAAQLRGLLQSAGDGLDIASLIIVPPADQALTAQHALPLVELAQAHNIAALLLDDAALARTLRADGVHLSAQVATLEGFATARDILGRRAIVGGDAGSSRHIAMELGELGADYIAFGHAAGDACSELIEWWAQIFEIPVVALDVTSPEVAAHYAALGADFVLVPLDANVPPRVLVETLKTLTRSLEEGRSHASKS